MNPPKSAGKVDKTVYIIYVYVCVHSFCNFDWILDFGGQYRRKRAFKIEDLITIVETVNIN